MRTKDIEVGGTYTYQRGPSESVSMLVEVVEVGLPSKTTGGWSYRPTEYAKSDVSYRMIRSRYQKVESTYVAGQTVHCRTLQEPMTPDEWDAMMVAQHEAADRRREERLAAQDRADKIEADFARLFPDHYFPVQGGVLRVDLDVAEEIIQRLTTDKGAQQ